MILLLIGGLYLAVSSKVADLGRDVMVLENRREELQRENDELRAELARSTSPDRMMELAQSLGFRPARLNEVTYVSLEAYDPPVEFVAPQPRAEPDAGKSALSPAYTETIVDFFRRWLGVKESR
jgi:hypothetical protein